MEKKKILSGHKQIGKLFIPPMKQIQGLQETSYIDDMLPELIWLGLINDTIGFIDGARFFEKIVGVATEIIDNGKKFNYALISVYGSFTLTQRESFVNELSNKSLLEPLREYLAPLVLLYDQCPMRFIGPPDTVNSEEYFVNIIKKCVGLCIDKYETPGIILNGMMLISRLITKTIRISSDITPIDINAILEKPDSEQAMRAASFIRANALAEFGILEIDNNWARYFWNRGYELSKCEFKKTDED